MDWLETFLFHFYRIFCIFIAFLWHFPHFYRIFLLLSHFLHFLNFSHFYFKTLKSINLRFFTPIFCNAPKFTPFFVPHRGKFTPGQSRFYDGKFTAVNSKKGVNWKTGVKVWCLPLSVLIIDVRQLCLSTRWLVLPQICLQWNWWNLKSIFNNLCFLIARYLLSPPLFQHL